MTFLGGVKVGEWNIYYHSTILNSSRKFLHKHAYIYIAIIYSHVFERDCSISKQPDDLHRHMHNINIFHIYCRRFIIFTPPTPIPLLSGSNCRTMLADYVMSK